MSLILHGTTGITFNDSSVQAGASVNTLAYTSGYFGGTGGGGGTVWYTQGDPSAVGSDVIARAPVSRAGTLKNLRVSLGAAPGSSESVVFTVVINGSASALTCTISNTDKVASDLSHTPSASAGDLISVKGVFSGSAAAPTNTGITWELEAS